MKTSQRWLWKPAGKLSSSLLSSFYNTSCNHHHHHQCHHHHLIRFTLQAAGSLRQGESSKDQDKVDYEYYHTHEALDDHNDDDDHDDHDDDEDSVKDDSHE